MADTNSQCLQIQETSSLFDFLTLPFYWGGLVDYTPQHVGTFFHRGSFQDYGLRHPNGQPRLCGSTFATLPGRQGLEVA